MASHSEVAPPSQRPPLDIIALTPPGLADPSLAIAASRAGAVGVLDLEYIRDAAAAAQAVARLVRFGRQCVGVKLRAGDVTGAVRPFRDQVESLAMLILTPGDHADLPRQVAQLRRTPWRILLDCTSLEDARAGERAGVDGIIARGHEGAGRVGDETAFVLLQRLVTAVGLPIWVQGGIGLHSAAAVWAAGGAGVVLDAQLYLTPESALPEPARSRIAAMDGSETACLGGDIGPAYRVFSRPGMRAVSELQEQHGALVQHGPSAEVADRWRRAVDERVGWGSPDTDLWLLGQDAAFAGSLAKRFTNVAGIVRGLREASAAHCAAAAELRPLDEGAALAVSHGTRYPIVQGPMTRVSDTAAFADAVAAGGALPFLALALMRGKDVGPLLEETRHRLGSRPWGVGILGFVPMEFREEQLAAIRACRPRFALIAGGRPDQARTLEAEGIATYLHVPSPGLLRLFMAEGARRFVFEGRECGGHVGPRSSFVLWESMIDVLLGAVPPEPAQAAEYHVIFAGGIHDALSASMVAVMAAPLAQRGVRIGVLMGTAYLFTEEAVAGGAIVKGFQEAAVACDRTVLLETGPGHLTRCVDSPYVETFREEHRRLQREGRPHDEARLALENLNLGRLRMASKGITRSDAIGEEASADFVTLTEDEQWARGMYMIGQVAALRERVISIDALHDEVSVEGSRRLEAFDAEPEFTSQADGARPCDIAIVGLSCILPKAPNAQVYWRNILNKVNAVTEIPADRWDWRLYFDPDRRAKDRIYSKWGGFLDDVAFEPMTYGMPPSSLASVEPLQLLTLEAVRAALTDAGYRDRPFSRDRTAVIIGAGGAGDLGQSYGLRAALPQFFGDVPDVVARLESVLPQWTEDSFAGILTNVAAGRVANRFDLGGANFTVDAACASSLAAVYLAMRELESGAADMAIVGGADTIQSPFAYLCFSKTYALSASGQCRTFDAGADGIAISEGVGMLVLKRLADAERDGDRIYAVLKSVAGASDGRDRGLTAPRPEGQVRTLHRAYAKAGVSPASIGLFEAHGTGTVAGDRAELESLSRVLEAAGAKPEGTAVGSVKSMIGHTKNTAGVAGLIKAALAVYRRVLPPTLGVETPNPRVSAPGSPLYVNTEVRPWLAPVDGGPRRAGVSAFGFGGTNFHAVLEEYQGAYLPDPARQTLEQRPGELFLWRASSRADLLRVIGSTEEALARGVEPDLAALAAAVHRAHGAPMPGGPAVALAIVATSLGDLRAKLASARGHAAQAAARVTDPRGLYFSEEPLAASGTLALLFPGQGSQYVDMLREMAVNFGEVRERFEVADRALDGVLPEPLSACVFPPPTFRPSDEQARRQALTRTNVAQPAVGAAGLGVFRLLQTFGVEPDMMAGHSYGEYVALCAAGVLREEDLFVLSEARGRFMIEGASGDLGGMAAVEAAPEAVYRVLAGTEGVVLANHNAPAQTVIAGGRAALDGAIARLREAGLGVRPLPVACAFHSPIVAPAQEKLGGLLGAMDLYPPRVPVYSNTTAACHRSEPQAIAAQLVEHVVSPVRFADEIRAMYDAGARIFVEVGPRNVLTGLVDQILGSLPHVALATDQPGRSPVLQLLHVLGRLAVEGISVRLDRLFDGVDSSLDLGSLRGDPDHGPMTWLVNGGRARPATSRSEPVARAATPPLAPTALPSPTAPLASTAPPSPTAPLAPTALPSPTAPLASTAPPSPTAPLASTALPSPTLPPSPPIVARAPAAGEKTPEFALPERAAVQPLPPAPQALGVSARAVASRSPADATGVMQQFQQLMQRFLDTQQRVMLAYLGGRATSTPPGIPSGSAVPVEPAPAAIPIARSHLGERDAPPRDLLLPVAPAPAPAGSPEERAIAVDRSVAAPPVRQADSVPRAAALTQQLLEVVSERTGYPAEMLGVDLDLEADLGIDSIKRIEILGEYRHRHGAGEEALGEEAMEKLTTIRTLRGIVDWILAASGIEESHPPALAGAAPVGAARAATLTQQLLEVVSERTGYPAEMLGVDLDLEADLGIDSIKRIEILGEYRHRHGAGEEALGEEAMEKLTTIRTLRGIIDWILAGSAPPAPRTAMPAAPRVPAGETATAGAPAPHEAPVAHPVRRHLLVASEIATAVSMDPARVTGVIAVTDDERGLAVEVAGRLRERAQAVVRVQHGQVASRLAADCYQADLSLPGSVSALVAMIRRDHGRIGGLVHLAPLARIDDAAATGDAVWRGRVDRDVKGLLNLARELHDDLREAGRSGGACLLTATGMGGAFGVAAPSFFPGHGGLTGLAKTLAREWPEVRVRALDVDASGSASDIAGCVLAEVAAASDVVEVGYQGVRRLTLGPVPAPLASGHAPALEIDGSWVILVTGGARGVTGRVALDIARRYRPTLILVGRSPAPPDETPDTAGLVEPRALKAALLARASVDGQLANVAAVEQAYRRLLQDREIRATLAGIAQAGASVEYVPLDVRDGPALAALVGRIYERRGRLDGVIHGAGVIEDKLIKDKSPESFDRVFETKVSAARALASALRPDTLKFLAFFASVAGAFGNRGQGDYAAANDVLNKLALALDRQWPGRVVSVNWGPWSSGMVSPELERQFASRGIAPISVEAGCQAMDAELRHGRKGEAVVLLTAGEEHAPSSGSVPARRRATPMLGESAPASNGGGGFHLIRTLDPTRDLYLQDHRLGGKAVLPMAVGCELIAETALLAVPGLDLIGVRDLRVLRGIVIDNGPRPVRIAATPLTTTAERTDVEVVITEAEDASRLHYRAIVELAPRLPEAPSEGWPTDGHRDSFPLGLDEAYRRWLFHGPRLQGLRAIRGLSAEGIHGVIAPSSPRDLLDAATGDAWLIDPVVVDGGLQLTLLWLRAHRDLAALPTGFRRYRRFAGPVGTLMDCRARIWIDTTSLTMHADLVFVGEGGKVVGVLEDVQGTCSKSVVQMIERSPAPDHPR